MKPRVVFIALLGLGLALYLIFHVGFSAVFQAALACGWSGMAAICAYALALFAVLGAAWHVLVDEPVCARLGVFIWGRIVRESAAEMLPFSHVGGFVIGARSVILRGVDPANAYASTIADVTMEGLAQTVYLALGTIFVIERAPPHSWAASLSYLLIILLGVAVAACVSLVVIQRKSTAIVEKFAGRFLPGIGVTAAAVASALVAIYRAPVRAALSFAIHVVCWMASALGTWIAFRLIGAQVDFEAVVAIDSLVYGARGVAFVMPNALGVQEAAYTALTPLFGVGPELGLAVSLLKRARDIIIGIPTLLIWQFMEGQRALKAAPLENRADEAGRMKDE